MTQNRWKSWALWTSLAGALWIIAEATGVAAMIGIEQSTYTRIFDAVGSILIAFGVVNNPTDPKNL